jgi:hypothetical protein
MWALPANGIGTVGAGRLANICIPDRGVSQRHATLTRQPDGRWLLRDVSSNGTFIMGRRLGEIVVEAGDIVQFGATRVLLLDRAPIDAIPMFDALLGTTPIHGHLPTPTLLEAITNAPRPLLLAGPHRKALELVATEVRRVVDLPLRWVDLQPRDAVKKLTSVDGISKAEAQKATLWAAAQDATCSTDPHGPWTLLLRASTKGAIVYYGANALHVPVRGLDEPPDDRADLAARIYHARPDLQPFLDVDALAAIVRDKQVVDVAEAWDAATRLAACVRAKGNKTAAAAAVGVSRPTIIAWVRRHGVNLPTPPASPARRMGARSRSPRRTDGA